MQAHRPDLFPLDEVMNSLRSDGVLFVCAQVLRVACKAKTEAELYDNHRLRYRRAKA